MITYPIIFFCGDSLAISGEITVEATTSQSAIETVSQMIIDHDYRLPDNWDRFMIDRRVRK